MRRAVRALALTFGLSVALPLAADAQSACSDYRVKRGDTLHKIAVRAYGFDNHRQVYRANAQRIGRNPDVIEIGTVLRLPCRREAEAPARTSAPRAFTFVTATDFSPYVDEAAPGGGLLTEIVEMAVRRSGAGDADVVFINDRRAHLTHLLQRGAFDASFPWPVCDGEECPDLRYSDPVFELTEGLFAPVGSDLLTVIDLSALGETLVCRPAGMAAAALEATHAAATVEGCFDALADGEVDLVAVDTRTGDMVLAGMGLSDEIAANPHLLSVVPVGVAVPAGAAGADATLSAINAGLAEMLRSGEWDAILSAGLNRAPGGMTN